MPHAGYVYPAGGQQGTTSKSPSAASSWMASTAAMSPATASQATVVDYFKPLTPAQATNCATRLGAVATSRIPKPRQIARRSPRSAPSCAGFVRRPPVRPSPRPCDVQIAIAPDAAPGERELRLARPPASPTLMFLRRPAARSLAPARQGRRRFYPARRRDRGQRTGAPRAGAAHGHHAARVVNGQIMPGGVDRYRFQATKGQHLVVAASARELIPYISDAVPGWFQAALDAARCPGQGSGLRRPLPLPSRPGALLRDSRATASTRSKSTIPIYRGREDFVYRIDRRRTAVRHRAFSRWAAAAGARTAVELKGWNLPAGKFTERRKGKPAGVYPISVRNGQFVSNACPSPWTPCRNDWRRSPTIARRTPSASSCRSSSTGASISRAMGRVPLRRPRRRGDRGRSVGPPARIRRSIRCSG